MLKHMPADIFIYLNGRPVSMRDIGPAADGPIDEALQAIVDKGLAGSFPPGTPWYHVFESNCFRLGERPNEDQEHLSVLYRSFKDYEGECQELSGQGSITDVHRSELERRYRAYQAMVKLSSE